MDRSRATGCFTLVVLAACVMSCGGQGRIPEGPPRNLVIISLDTVRQDHLPTYGYPRDTAPAVDRLARGAVVFDNAFAQEPNTTPSHASMFTGLYPFSHGSLDNGWRLPPGKATLAGVLRAAGFSTGAFVSGYTMRAKVSGLDDGFDVYEDEFEGGRREGRVTTEAAIHWLRERPDGRRYFVFLHLFDAHGPYLPTARYSRMFESDEPGILLERIPPYQRITDMQGNPQRHLNGYVDRYDAMIRYQDDLVGRFLDEIDLRDTIVVVLSDHGETLGERYWMLDHGGHVTDEQIRIPFVIHVPGEAPRRVEAAVETLDLVPTLLDLLDLEAPVTQGRNLAPLIRGEPDEARPLVFASARPGPMRYGDRGYDLDTDRRVRCVRSARWKLVAFPGRERDYYELYDLEADPAEDHDVAADHPDVRDKYVEALRRWEELASAAPSATPQLDPEVLDNLRSLGYVGD